MPIDFEFTEEQQMFRDTIRDFGENEITQEEPKCQAATVWSVEHPSRLSSFSSRDRVRSVP